jgi:nucleotide-binding universal stress UspA family protein
MISKILVPVVFSARCQDATRYAAALACRFHSKLVLMHVFVQPWAAFSAADGYATPPPFDLDSTIDQVKAQLGSFLQDELSRIEIVTEVRQGDPAREIAEYACTEGCSLIVMPTHGYGPFRRFLLGSVTAKVLHDVHCPVFTGPHLEHPPALESPSFHKVLCAMDSRPESRSVLEWALRFTREFGGTLSIVHAIPAAANRLDGIYFDPEWRADLLAKTRAHMDDLRRETAPDADLIVESGDVPGVVHSVVQAIGADLVVAGRGHARGMLGRLRANTYGIVRESPCPVIAV